MSIITSLLKQLSSRFDISYDLIYKLFKCKLKGLSGLLSNRWLELLYELIYGSGSLSDLIEEILDSAYFADLMASLLGSSVSAILIAYIKSLYELLMAGNLTSALVSLLADFTRALAYAMGLNSLFTRIISGLVSVITASSIINLEDYLVDFFNKAVELTVLDKKALTEAELLLLFEQISGLSGGEISSALWNWIMSEWNTLKGNASASVLPSVTFRMIRASDDSIKDRVYNRIKTQMVESPGATAGMDYQMLASLIEYEYANAKRNFAGSTRDTLTICTDKGFILENFITYDRLYGEPTITANHIQNLKTLYNTLLVPIINHYRAILPYDCLLYIIYGLCSPRFARGVLNGSVRDPHTTGEAVDFMITGVNSGKVIKAIRSGDIQIPYKGLGRGNAGIHISTRSGTADQVVTEYNIIQY